MRLNFSIGKELVIDCRMEGWPEGSRQQFQSQSLQIAGVTSAGGAGHSTTRVRYSVASDENRIRNDLTNLANAILPGHNFSC